MSGHPHKGKRSEWISCQTPPTINGLYEYTFGENRQIFVVHYVNEWWINWVDGDVPEDIIPYHADLWRGLAEKPE